MLIYSLCLLIIAQLGTSAMDNTLLKYSAKDHFFKAVLCHMCFDKLNGQLALKKYKDLQPAFADSRESKFLEVRSNFDVGKQIYFLKGDGCTKCL